VLDVMRIDRSTDVQSDLKSLPKEPTRLKLMKVGIRIAENLLNSLPNPAGIVTRQDTRMWVISYITNINFLHHIAFYPT